MRLILKLDFRVLILGFILISIDNFGVPIIFGLRHEMAVAVCLDRTHLSFEDLV